MTISNLCSSWFTIYFNQFFVLNLDGCFDVLSNKFIIFSYSIIMLYYYSNLNFLSFFRRYIFLDISILLSFVYECNFLNAIFWSTFFCICCRFLASIKKFLTILIAYGFSNFSCICTNTFGQRQKSISIYIYSFFRFNWITYF